MTISVTGASKSASKRSEKLGALERICSILRLRPNNGLYRVPIQHNFAWVLNTVRANFGLWRYLHMNKERYGFCCRANGCQHELVCTGQGKDLRQRIHFTLGLLIVYRLGTFIPVPGIDAAALQEFMDQAQQGIGGMLSMFTGGALGRMGIFALGIMPYISASIIVQLLTSMVPQLEQLKKEGEQGRKKINQYTRYGTVLLATLQAYGLAASLEAGEIVTDPGLFSASPASSPWLAERCS